MSIGPLQILIVILLVLLVFGAGKLPKIMGDMAEGIKAFKKGIKDDGKSEVVNKIAASEDNSIEKNILKDKEKN